MRCGFLFSPSDLGVTSDPLQGHAPRKLRRKCIRSTESSGQIEIGINHFPLLGERVHKYLCEEWWVHVVEPVQKMRGLGGMNTGWVGKLAPHRSLLCTSMPSCSCCNASRFWACRPGRSKECFLLRASGSLLSTLLLWKPAALSRPALQMIQVHSRHEITNVLCYFFLRFSSLCLFFLVLICSGGPIIFHQYFPDISGFRLLNQHLGARQITIIPKPELRGFGRDSLTKPPFGVTNRRELVVITYRCNRQNPWKVAIMKPKKPMKPGA